MLRRTSSRNGSGGNRRNSVARRLRAGRSGEVHRGLSVSSGAHVLDHIIRNEKMAPDAVA